MKSTYVDINGIPTCVTTWGIHVDDTFTAKEMVLCIPGNPGWSGLYRRFLATLHARLGIPVWIVGHSGHEEPPADHSTDIPPFEGNEKLYGTEGQIENKVSYTCFLVYHKVLFAWIFYSEIKH